MYRLKFYKIYNNKQYNIHNEQNNQEQLKFKNHDKNKGNMFSYFNSMQIKYINKSSKGCQQENKLEYLYLIHFRGR